MIFLQNRAFKIKQRIFIWLILCGSVAAHAQSAGVVRGTIKDAAGASIAGAKVKLENTANGSKQETSTNGEGRFQFFNVPFAVYKIEASAANFAAAATEIALRSTVPAEIELTLNAAGLTEQITITSGDNGVVEPARSEYTVDAASITNLTGALASRQIENLVLSLPGTAKDGKGTFHPRGAHYQASFVIDGVPVSDQLSTIYANNFDARNVADASVQLGNIAPEFGNKVSAVIQITTPSGLGSGKKIFGDFSIGAGSFDTVETGFKIGGETFDKKFGYFVSATVNRTNRFLDPPFQNAVADFGSGQLLIADARGFHNGGDGQNIFARFDYAPNERDFFKLNLSLARSRFEIPNLPVQELSDQDQVQENRNLAVYPQYQRVFNQNIALTIAPYLRISTAESNSSAGDTPISFDYARRLPTYGIVANAAYSNKNHQLKIGVDAFVFPTGERFAFELTDPNYNRLPANSSARINPDNSANFTFDPNLTPAEINRILIDFNPNLIAFDRTILAQAVANNSTITGAPRAFDTNPRKIGKQFSAYAQDTFSYKRLTVSGGARFDRYSFLVNETALSPRVGAAFRLPVTNTLLRASYNRIVQTPSTENLLISSSAESAALVNPGTVALLGTRLLRIPAERANWFEFGVNQTLGKFGRVDAAVYRKRINNLHDNDQFLNTTIIFPIALRRGRVDGADVRFESNDYKGFGGYLSLGTVRARVRPPFSGGLFLSGATPADFSGAEFTIDHDQKINLQTAVRYSKPKRGLFAQILARYDSGLVTGVARGDTADLLADPDVAAGVALLNFNENPVRTRARTIFDASIAYDFFCRENFKIGAQFDALNLANKIGLYNYLSVFGGTNYIPARSFNARVRIDF